MRTVMVTMCVVGLALAVFVDDALGGARSEDPLGVAVSPQTLILDSPQGGEVKVHTDIPYGTVDLTSLKLNGVEAIGTYSDACGNLVVDFNEEDIEAIVEVPEALLTLTGVYKAGEPFEGSDKVRVIEK